MEFHFFRFFYPSMVIMALVVSGSCKRNVETQEVYASENLRIQKISEHSYIHISFLNTDEFGKVACNGMIFTDQTEAIVFDTPVSNMVSTELINWIENELKVKIKTVVASHFHIDAAGGLESFHQKRISSYANQETIDMLKESGETVPEHGIISSYEHTIGDKKLLSVFVGEGHSKDNIVAYFPSEKVLYGGCLIKELGAGKGNLKDANINEWAATVQKLKILMPDAEIIVPGHGGVGGRDLLDYTIEKMKIDQ